MIEDINFNPEPIKPRKKAQAKKKQKSVDKKRTPNIIDKARAMIKMYKGGNISILNLEDALSTLGYSKSEIRRIKDLAKDESAEDLYERYFVSPDFSEEGLE